MDADKQRYLEQIRLNTAYPTYRGIIGLITILGYAMSGATALFALISALATMANISFWAGLGALLMGAIGAALIFFLARLWNDAAMILVDMGDSITEANSRGVLNEGLGRRTA